jgi:hypothetical protein
MGCVYLKGMGINTQLKRFDNRGRDYRAFGRVFERAADSNVNVLGVLRSAVCIPAKKGWLVVERWTMTRRDRSVLSFCYRN